MKRVALCLSGHVRTYKFTRQFWIHHVLSQYKVDVFMHLWDTVGPRSFGDNRTEHNPLPRTDYDSGIVPSNKVDANEVSGIWNPVSLVIENYEDLHNTFVQQVQPILDERDRRGIPAGFEHHHPLSVRSMMYKRFKCNELKSEAESVLGKKYDLVIQTRPDVAITDHIQPIMWTDQSNLYFHNCRSVTPDPEINDFGCMGSSTAVDTWCNLYNKVDSLFDVLKQDDNYFKFLNPHKMYVQYLKSENQPYVESDIGLSIVRDTGIVLGWPHAQNIIRGMM